MFNNIMSIFWLGLGVFLSLTEKWEVGISCFIMSELFHIKNTLNQPVNVVLSNEEKES